MWILLKSLLSLALCALLALHGTDALATSPVSPASAFVCANATENMCDKKCEGLKDSFKRHYSHGWAVRHESLGNAFAKLRCRIIIEIGVARGELSQFLLKRLHGIVEEYHGVDGFQGGYDSTDAMSQELTAASQPLAWSQAIVDSFKHSGCIFRMHRGMSHERVNDFTDNSVDCIFVDGDHTYAGAKRDIDMYAKKLRPGGHFIFDDYSKSYMGVVKAVDELVDVNRLDFHKINSHNNYYVQKPTDRPLNSNYTYPDDDKVPLPPIPSF